MSAVHKTGPLKQHNKSHKNGRHKSKGELDAVHKGRVGIKSHSKKGLKEVRKADRRNQQKQLRANKRWESLNSKRRLGTDGSPPHLVVVLPLSDDVDLTHLNSLLHGACDLDDPAPLITTPSFTLISTTLKQRFTIVYPSTSDLYALLDVAKVADTLLLIHKADSLELSSTHSLLLDCLMAQGLPSTLHLAQGLKTLTGKSLTAAKKCIQKSMEARFPNDKLLSADNVQNALTILRVLSTHKRKPVLSRDQHAHLLVDHLRYAPQEEGDRGTLYISGYVRAKSLSVNSLLYIPGMGEYQMAQIDSPKDPYPFLRGEKNGMMVDNMEEDEMEEDIKVLDKADPSKQESLESEVVPDPMQAEQTWPSEHELRDAETARSRRKVAKRVPMGTSDYQAAWILESDSDQEEEEETSDGEDIDMEGEGEGLTSEGEESSSNEGDLDYDTDAMTMPDVEEYDDNFDADAEEKQLQRLRAEKDHLMFPDEVDTPIDVSARVRFQKYRGLKSFRSSPWDPLENLPPDYARIFQFENFNRTKKKVLKSNEDKGAMLGWYVTLHVSNVPSNYVEKMQAPTVVYSLLPHENKMSVVHYVLRRTNHSSLPIKSKDELIFHSGVRRFSAQPIFSQHTPGDKHKFERFFAGDGGCYIASVYAPIGYPPQPVLVFGQKEGESGEPVLVATGSLYKVAPRRVICKRIVLSGHPYKINKNSAVIRYMFFNREDILWFKPVELRTKHGRRGHIKEPLGTHGHMKCVFDGQLKAQDTILMNLYKRVYPKWTITSP